MIFQEKRDTPELMNPSIIRYIPISETLKYACKHLIIRGNMGSSGNSLALQGLYRLAAVCSQIISEHNIIKAHTKCSKASLLNPKHQGCCSIDITWELGRNAGSSPTLDPLSQNLA